MTVFLAFLHEGQPGCSPAPAPCLSEAALTGPQCSHQGLPVTTPQCLHSRKFAMVPTNSLSLWTKPVFPVRWPFAVGEAVLPERAAPWLGGKVPHWAGVLPLS